jgi:hypothetical protein
MQKPGKRGRKIGKGVRKMSHSKYGTYAALFAHYAAEQDARAVKRQKKLQRLRAKRGGFRTKRAMLRARKFAGRASVTPAI